MEISSPDTGRMRPRVRGLDCEMVGVGRRGKKSVLVRVSVIGRFGRVLLDCLVRPDEEVTDWRTAFTGVDASTFASPAAASREVLTNEEAVSRANTLLDNAVVVGHDLRHDFKLLGRFHHRRVFLRDTAFCPLLNAGLEGREGKGGCPSLRALAEAWLDEGMHGGRVHDSVEDARAAMLLYRIIAPQWEKYARRKWGPVPPEALQKPCISYRARRQQAVRGRRCHGLRLSRRLRLLRRRGLSCGAAERKRKPCNPAALSEKPAWL